MCERAAVLAVMVFMKTITKLGLGMKRNKKITLRKLVDAP